MASGTNNRRGQEFKTRFVKLPYRLVVTSAAVMFYLYVFLSQSGPAEPKDTNIQPPGPQRQVAIDPRERPPGWPFYRIIAIFELLVVLSSILIYIFHDELIALRILLVGSAIGGLAIVYAAVEYPDYIRERSIAVASIAGAIAIAVSPKTIRHIEFFEVTAQVVPVLFLALAVEVRGFFGEVIAKERFTFAVITSLLLVAGGESLRVLAIGDPTRGIPSVIIATLAIVAFELGILAITGPQERQSSNS
jgi:hypothetical protein